MPGPIDGLREAGFNDNEISQWSVEKRDALTAAGFKDNEVDAYLAGGPVVTDEIPEAMLERIAGGNVARRREGGLAQSIPEFPSLISTPDGRAKLWEGLKKYPAKLLGDMIDLAKVPGDVAAGQLDLSTEEGMEKAIGLGMLVGPRFNKLTATGNTSAMTIANGGTVSRISKGPMGEIVDLPIGTLAKSEDMVNAAVSLAGANAPRAVQEKLNTLYKESGVHPSEIAHDAATDPIIAQKLLSSEPKAMPYVEAYHGSPVPFHEFDPAKAPYYFTPDAAVAGQYAASTYNEGFAALRGKVIVEDAGKQPHIVPAQLDMQRPFTADMWDFPEAAKARDPEWLRQNGYDSAVLHDPKDPTATEFLVLDRSQINPRYADGAGGGGRKPPPNATSKEPPAPPPEGSFEAAQQKVLDKISVGDNDPVKTSFRKIYTNAIDDLHPIKAASEDAYELARLTRGQFGKAEHFIEHGTFDFKTYETNGKGLREILDPVKDDLNGFRAYLTSKRAIDIEASGRKSGIDLEAATRVAAEGDAKFAEAAGDLLKYQNNALKYLKDSGVLSERAYEAMVDANKNYVPFYRVFFPGERAPGSKGFGPGNPIKELVGSDRGIIDPLESVVKNTYAYISIAERNAVGVKVIDALTEQGMKESTKRPKMEGAEADLVDHLKQAGVRDAEALIDFVKTTAADDGTAISAWRDGKRIAVETGDADLVQAFKGMDQQSVGWLTKALALPARGLRAGATLSPDFMARNLIRDFQTAFVNSKGLFSPIDTAKGVASVITKDANFQNWLKSGGANSTMVAMDRFYLQESLATLTKETGLMSRAWNVVTNPLAPLRMVSELMENATRVGEFRKVAGKATDKDTLQAAGFASREVTLDFARIGAQMRAYNMITAFANAQIQGMDRIGRAFADRPINTTAKIAGGITLPSILLWYANHGDPRYEELPDWQKDLFWIVTTNKWEKASPEEAAGKPDHLVRQQGGQTEVNNGHIFRIPKPFELGVIFGSGVERALDATVGKNKDAFEGFSKSVMDVLTPSYIPTAVQPVFEQWANRSTFSDRTLIPADMEKHLPEYQYTPYTTELSKKLGQVISAFPGVRDAATEPGHIGGPAARALTTPILIENYIKSWTGGLGTYALNAADLALRKADVLPDPVTPTPTLADIPFIKAFAVRYPSSGADSIQHFYDDFEKNKRFFDTWMAKAREGDTEAVDRIQEAGGPLMFVQLDGIKQTLSEHSKLVRDVYKNQEMPAGEKRQIIDSLYYSMIEIGKAGRKMMKDAKAITAPDDAQ